MTIWRSLLVLLSVCCKFPDSTISASNDSPGCPDIKFIGCLFRLRAQRVPFEKNMMNVVFGVKSEARLIHTCKAYSETMPCFRDKILECGNQKQRKLLHEVSRLLMFMCSPFSLPRQKSLIKHQHCISNILKMPATTGCTPEPVYQEQLQACRSECAKQPSDFICIMKTWVTEQNLCTVADINSKCGEDAAQFYTDLQVTVFEPMFPVLCELPANYQVPSTSTIAPPPPVPSAAPSTSSKSTRLQMKFSRRITNEIPNKTLNSQNVPNVVWNGMPQILSEPTPLREHFPTQKTSFATLLNHVFPSNVTDRFMAFNYSSVPTKSTLRSKPISRSSTTLDVLSAPQAFPLPEPSVVPYQSGSITRQDVAQVTTTAVPIRVFSAKPRFSDRSYLSWRQRSATAPNIVGATRRWKPWYLGGETALNEETKRQFPLYHGVK